MFKFDGLFRFRGYADAALVSLIQTCFLVLLLCSGAGLASEVSRAVSEGNRLYGQGDYEAAGAEYDRAAELKPGLLAPKFNKANSDYKLKKLQTAIDSYKEVAARSSDKKLAAKAKYNLGNSYFRKAREAEAAGEAMKFQQAAEGRQPAGTGNPVDDYRAAVRSWRQVLDIDADNENARRNIEIAKHAIKKLKEQQQQQQQNQDQQQDGENSEDREKKNQENDDKNKDTQDQQDKQEGQDDQKQDEKKNDGRQDEDENKQDKKDQQDQQQGSEDEKEQPKTEPDPQEQDESDAAADEILKKEKQDKKKRRVIMVHKVPVEKDW